MQEYEGTFLLTIFTPAIADLLCRFTLRHSPASISVVNKTSIHNMTLFHLPTWVYRTGQSTEFQKMRGWQWDFKWIHVVSHQSQSSASSKILKKKLNIKLPRKLNCFLKLSTGMAYITVIELTIRTESFSTNVLRMYFHNQFRNHTGGLRNYHTLNWEWIGYRLHILKGIFWALSYLQLPKERQLHVLSADS